MADFQPPQHAAPVLVLESVGASSDSELMGLLLGSVCFTVSEMTILCHDLLLCCSIRNLWIGTPLHTSPSLYLLSSSSLLLRLLMGGGKSN